MGDVFSRITRPCDVDLPHVERRANRVNRFHPLGAIFNDVKRNSTHSSHRSHRDDNVRRVRNLNTDAGNGRANWPHEEGDDIHRSAAHRFGKELRQRQSHVVGVVPIVGWSSVTLRPRADERPSFDAGDIVGVASCEE